MNFYTFRTISEWETFTLHTKCMALFAYCNDLKQKSIWESICVWLDVHIESIFILKDVNYFYVRIYAYFVFRLYINSFWDYISWACHVSKTGVVTFHMEQVWLPVWHMLVIQNIHVPVTEYMLIIVISQVIYFVTFAALSTYYTSVLPAGFLAEE